MITAESIGRRIKELAKKRKITLKELAKKAYVSRNTIMYCVHGRTIPNGLTLAYIARALDTTVEYLVFGNGREHDDT